MNLARRDKTRWMRLSNSGYREQYIHKTNEQTRDICAQSNNGPMRTRQTDKRTNQNRTHKKGKHMTGSHEEQGKRMTNRKHDHEKTSK